MSTVSTTDRARSVPRWFTFGLSNLVIVLVLAVVSWWLLADPKWSPFHFYPLPFNAVLFWAILFIVFVGFNCEFAGLDRLAQPARGLLLIALTAVFSIGVTWLLGFGLGRLYPDFDAHRAGGTGYFAGALFVLFAFFIYVMIVINFGHWPWTALGLRQPMIGLCEIAFAFIPTLAVYLIWGLPSVSVATPPGHAPMTVNVVLGFFYSFVVATLATGLAAENMPWAAAGSRGRDGTPSDGRVAAAATIGNIVLGVVLYFALWGVSTLLIGSHTTKALGDVIHQFPAQIGVCWAFWIIFWSNAFGNWPNSGRRGANIVARIAITFVLGVLTFVLYYYWAAQHVLHEPVVAGSLHGNALGFIDWAVLCTLFYVVGLGSYGLRAPGVGEEAGPSTADPVAAPAAADQPVAQRV